MQRYLKAKRKRRKQVRIVRDLERTLKFTLRVLHLLLCMELLSFGLFLVTRGDKSMSIRSDNASVSTQGGEVGVRRFCDESKFCSCIVLFIADKLLVRASFAAALCFFSR